MTVIRNLIAQEVQCREIRPGELVKVKKDCDVPCDMVLLWSSDSRGKCFVTTANLDGETSLKPLKVPKPLLNTTFDKTFQDKIKMEILKPEPDIYTFFGRMDVGENMNTPIGTTNLLLRGSRIKNTEWAIGCAIYTGSYIEYLNVCFLDLTIFQYNFRKRYKTSDEFQNNFKQVHIIRIKYKQFSIVFPNIDDCRSCRILYP